MNGLGGLLICVTLGACSGGTSADGSEEPRCTSAAAGTARETLVNASDDAAYAALSAAERGALGRFGASRSATRCTGVRVTPTWALTAGHCSELAASTFYGEDGGVQRVDTWVRHPEADVALARLGPGDCKSTLPLVGLEQAPAPLSRATLAGYGLDAEGRLGRLAFLVEAVVTTTPEAVEVNGFGQSGACVGDSGGPLLVRDASGRVAVLGVLSAGAQSCVEVDRYLRMEPLVAWIRSHLTLPEAREACGAIDERGRCFDGRAVYCDGGRLVADACAADTTCGFVPSAQGFRCSAAPSCAGDAFGFCQAGAAIHCDEAGAVVTECDASGLGCGYAPDTGVATCR
jgi:hypothetical protein